MKKIATLIRTSNSSISIKKKKEEEIVPFERISCLSPQLVMKLAESTCHGEDACEVCLE